MKLRYLAAAMGLVLLAVLFTLGVSPPAFSQGLPKPVPAAPVEETGPNGAPLLPFWTGSATGSYFKFATAANKICGQNLGIKVMPSGGTTANIDAALNNQTALFEGQIDVLALMRTQGNTSVNTIKLATPLFPEQLHFIAAANLTKTEGGFNIGTWNPLGNKVPLRDVGDLAGKPIVASGGSFKTLQIFNLFSGLNAQVTSSKTPEEAIDKVLRGEAAAVLLVGAAPLKTLQDVGDNLKKLRLLPVPESMISKVSGTYQRSGRQLSYPGMADGGDTASTLEVMSGLFVLNYPESEVGDRLYTFVQCLLREAPKQALIPGTHPAWSSMRTESSLAWDTWKYAGAAKFNAAPATPTVTRPVKK